ncbi:uncharacterized protein LOC142582935 isoform X3 [Dermacentor variabilis]|uniref:uncharacterized protein LOC142582935 isoform X3 n=1 Tax=Dermacentor variabilis TaxID=34621 RepID=UPI003F5C76B9
MLPAALFYVVWAVLESGVRCIRILSLEVPQTVVVGTEARLRCAYDLEGDVLYSVKWYRDDVEFFRFVPSDRPPGQFFPVDGIRVDLQRSNNGTVFIRNVDHLTGGNYKCEVSADAPSFKTMFVEKLIRIDSSSTHIQVPSAMALLLLALASRAVSHLVSNR